MKTFTRRKPSCRRSRFCAAAALAFVALLAGGRGEEPVELTVHFDRPIGALRALHGINKGPLAAGGLIDVTAAQRALGVPLTRLHDCHWPNPDVVDMHVVFPDFAADPERPESYDFALTDEYLAAVRATGAPILYRLGESIEHTKTRRFVHPPASVEKWAAMALGIVRHYNEGWARGAQHGIRYWEIWNEPENRPVMWSGSDADYYQLYKAAAAAIKAHDPTLKVGGPAVGNPGKMENGVLRPTPFVSGFLDFCRAQALPLDFFSWHCYAASPSEIVAKARAVRELLNSRGFPQAESHLNEWNYLPRNDWGPVLATAAPLARQEHYAAMAGGAGAAFIVATLLELQDAPLDMANLFHGELGGFGLFNEHGVPTPNYDGVLAFHTLLETPHRVDAPGGGAGKLAIAAGLNEARSRGAVLVSNFAQPQTRFRLLAEALPWSGATEVELHIVDQTRRFETAQTTRLEAGARFDFELPAPAVALLRLRPAAEGK